MGYFNEFPHTRSYDGDLGYLIKMYKKLVAEYGSIEDQYKVLVKIYEQVHNDIESITIEQLQKWLDDGTFAEILKGFTETLQNEIDTLSESKIDKNGVGQVTLNNLSQEVKEALTGGSVAIVGRKAISDVNIISGSIKKYNCEFYNSNNKFNYYDCKSFQYGYLKGSTGENGSIVTPYNDNENQILISIPIQTDGNTSYNIIIDNYMAQLCKIGYTTNETLNNGDEVYIGLALTDTNLYYNFRPPFNAKQIVITIPYVNTNVLCYRNIDNSYQNPYVEYGTHILINDLFNSYNDKLIVNINNQNIYVSIPIDDDYYITVHIKQQSTNKGHIYSIFTLYYSNFINQELNILYDLCSHGNFEIAIQTMKDDSLHQYGGAAHGFENVINQYMYIDDNTCRFSIVDSEYCNVFKLITNSNIYDEDDNIICVHNIEMVIDTINGVTFNQSLTWKKTFNIYHCYLGMIPIFRNNNNIQITDSFNSTYNNTIIDASESGFTSEKTYNTYKYFIYSSFLNFVLEITQGFSNSNNILTFIQNAPSPNYNKYYCSPVNNETVNENDVTINNISFKFKRKVNKVYS